MKKRFPLWLFCLILFAVVTVIIGSNVRKLATSGVVPVVTSVPVEAYESPAVTNAQDAQITVEPADIETETLPAEESPAIPAESEVSEPEPSAEPEPEAPAEEGIHVHTYRDGVCTGCGQKPVFCTGFLPEEYYIPASNQGSLVRFAYTVTAYADHSNGTYNKELLIYLPYGYDETKPYNVLVLVPAGEGTENDWLNKDYQYGDYVINGKNIVDNMFEKGDCEPCIIVCPQVETPFCQGLTAGIYQMRDELRNNILPYIVDTYSTYASDSSLESLQAARSHFALGGPSNGALFVYEGGMRYNFDLFAGYMALSGNGQPWNTVDIIQLDPYRTLPIQCLFTGAGSTNDWQQNYTQIGYDFFIQNEARLKEGINAWHIDVEGDHEWKVWLTGLYNALPLLFQESSVV